MVGAGVTVADLPLYAGHNDLGTAALLAAMHDRGLGALVLASSMVVYGEGRYACAEHGRQQPPARERAALDAGDFENHCATCGRTLSWELVPEDARLDPRSSYAASKVAQEHYALAWARQAGARAIGLRYHNVYGPGMPRDTPYSGVAAIFRSSLEHDRAPRVFEDGGQMRDFVHVHDVARANLMAIDAVRGRPAESWSAYNVCSGTPVPILRIAELLSAAADGPAPEVTGDYRAGDVRHVVASPELAASELGFTAMIAPDQGIPEFATAPLRA
jgi:dTDP-L-rhamnose 4-epimerase